LPYGFGFIANYNSKTHELSNWTSFSAPDSNVTHFQGLSLIGPETYIIAADSQKGIIFKSYGVLIKKKNTFIDQSWIEIKYPIPTSTVSLNSVVGNNFVGVYFEEMQSYAFQATIN